MASGDLTLDYSGPHWDSKYLWSCNILNAAKINRVNKHLGSVVMYRIYVNHKSCVFDMFDIARNVAKN